MCYPLSKALWFGHDCKGLVYSWFSAESNSLDVDSNSIQLEPMDSSMPKITSYITIPGHHYHHSLLFNYDYYYDYYDYYYYYYDNDYYYHRYYYYY